MHRSFSRFMLLAGPAVLGSSMLAGAAHAQSEATASADSSVTIIAPIAITKDSDLQFGSVARGTTGSNTVAIDATTGDRALTGAGDAGLAPGGATTRAAYTVTGEEDATFSIALEESTVTLSSGSDTIDVTLASSATTGTLTAGTASFGVGGSFEVTSSTVAGDYTGSFDVTVAYN